MKWSQACRLDFQKIICHKKQCRDPGSNRGPLDLQSNALPTELSRLTDTRGSKMTLLVLLLSYCYAVVWYWEKVLDVIRIEKYIYPGTSWQFQENPRFLGILDIGSNIFLYLNKLLKLQKCSFLGVVKELYKISVYALNITGCGALFGNNGGFVK